MKLVLQSLTVVFTFALLGCEKRNEGDAQLSPVDPKLAAEMTMRSFAQLIGSLTPEQRSKLTSIEQLYQHVSGTDDFSSINSASWSHTEWEVAGRPRFDYVIFPIRGSVPSNDAILLATPREIRIRHGLFARVALTHSLEITHITETDFHRQVLKQSGVLSDNALSSPGPTSSPDK